MRAPASDLSLHSGRYASHSRTSSIAPERLARYGARGPVAESRLRRLDDGRYEHTPKGDRLPLVLTADVLMKRLAALLPPPRKHLTSFHGVHGPNSKLHPLVVRALALDASTTVSSSPSARAAKAEAPRLDWATLQARTVTFATSTLSQLLLRSSCGQRRRGPMKSWRPKPA